MDAGNSPTRAGADTRRHDATGPEPVDPDAGLDAGYYRARTILFVFGGVVMTLILCLNVVALADVLPIPSLWPSGDAVKSGYLSRLATILQTLGGLSVVTGLLDRKRVAQRFDHLAQRLGRVDLLRDFVAPTTTENVGTVGWLLLGILVTWVDMAILLFQQAHVPMDFWWAAFIIFFAFAAACVFPFGAAAFVFVLNKLARWWADKPFDKIVILVTLPLFLLGQLLQYLGTYN